MVVIHTYDSRVVILDIDQIEYYPEPDPFTLPQLAIVGQIKNIVIDSFLIP